MEQLDGLQLGGRPAIGLRATLTGADGDPRVIEWRGTTRGVWTLPPRFRLGETDRDKYAAIGESDRMTMKFRKP